MYFVIAWVAKLMVTTCDATAFCSLHACNVSSLRIINGLLFGTALDFSVWKLTSKIPAFASVVCMPIVAFYSVLYYTDTAATATVFSSLALFQTGNVALSGLAGLVAVAMRQTNIVWVFVMACGHLVNTADQLENLPDILNDRRRKGRALLELRFHILAGIGFAVFLKANDWSPVLGHKEYHGFKAHFAQLNYFLTTTLFVSGHREWWRVIQRFKDALTEMIAGNSTARRSLLRFLFLSVLFSICARFGTITHDFILSDNRHFTFYLWRRVLKHTAVREILVPAISSAAAVFSTPLDGFRLSKNHSANSILFWVGVVLVIVPSALFEFRYFSIPLAMVSLSYMQWKWNLALTISLVGLFVFFPFQNRQTGNIDRFML